jgi:hypothetical protein
MDACNNYKFIFFKCIYFHGNPENLLEDVGTQMPFSPRKYFRVLAKIVKCS